MMMNFISLPNPLDCDCYVIFSFSSYTTGD